MFKGNNLLEKQIEEEDPFLFIKLLKDNNTKPSFKEIKNYLYGKICFRSENYLSGVKDIKEKFDTIICFSVTKWIHLNYGDIGIKILFLKAYE